MMKRVSESRKYPRIPSDFPVIFKLGETTAKIHSVNVGGGGLRLETSALPCGAELMVRFRTSKHQAFIQTKARVIYTLPDLGSGVEFTNIDQEHLQIILRAIHGNAGNRRKAPRVPLATQIHIDDSMALAYSRDLSTGGIFIDTKEPSEIGTEVDIRFRLSEDDPIIIAKGKVRYVVPRLGMGVQFTEVSDQDRKRIVTFVLSSGEILPESSPEESPS
ncbi:MAG: PilZ domain-containing protein [Acidobacteria bacterium]|nr:PilZ domain-containing protein [Acidobacteriota bacterium]